MVGDPFGYGLLMPKQRNKLNKGTYFEYTEALKPKHSFTYEMWGKDQKGNPLFNWLDDSTQTLFEDYRHVKNLPKRSLKKYGDSIYDFQEKYGNTDFLDSSLNMPRDAGFKFYGDK